MRAVTFALRIGMASGCAWCREPLAKERIDEAKEVADSKGGAGVVPGGNSLQHNRNPLGSGAEAPWQRKVLRSWRR